MDTSYCEWKKWNLSNFGILSSINKAYFVKELKKVKLPPYSKVCDYGFGNGEFLAFSKYNKWKVTGVEINKNLRKIAKKNNFFVQSPKQFFKTKDQEFDLITLFDVIEHFPQAKSEILLRLLRTKLKPNGFILCRFPNGDSPFSLYHQNADPTHCNFIGSKKIKFLANCAKLKIFYLGPQAVPIWKTPFPKWIYNLLKKIIYKIGNLAVQKIFFPKDKDYFFFSANLVCLLKK